MSTPETTIDADPTAYDEYDEMIAHLNNAIDEVNYKINDGRICDAQKDQARVKYYRALGYLVRSQLKVIEQRDLQLLEERIEQLEESES